MDEETNTDSPEKPPGYDEIRSRLGDHREQFLRELNRAGGECDVATLRDQDHADIPSGSGTHHVRWLHGMDVHGRPLRWWPDDAGQLIQTVGRVKQYRGGDPTRLVRLTKYGARFLECLLAEGNVDGDSPSEGPQIDELQMVIQSHESRLQELTKDVRELSEQPPGPEEDGDDGLEERVEDNEETVREILMYVKEIQDELGISTGDKK